MTLEAAPSPSAWKDASGPSTSPAMKAEFTADRSAHRGDQPVEMANVSDSKGEYLLRKLSSNRRGIGPVLASKGIEVRSNIVQRNSPVDILL